MVLSGLLLHLQAHDDHVWTAPDGADQDAFTSEDLGTRLVKRARRITRKLDYASDFSSVEYSGAIDEMSVEVRTVLDQAAADAEEKERRRQRQEAEAEAARLKAEEEAAARLAAEEQARREAEEAEAGLARWGGWLDGWLEGWLLGRSAWLLGCGVGMAPGAWSPHGPRGTPHASRGVDSAWNPGHSARIP